MRFGKWFIHTVMAACLILVGLGSGPAWGGAAGYLLKNPDSDVARLFPESTGYRVVSLDFQKAGGQKLLATVEAKMRDQLHGLRERIDAPYDVYVIYRDDKKIGFIHGVDQKSPFGGMRIFLALDLKQRIKTLYIQEMKGPHAGKMRAAQFTKQFTGLSLADFEQYNVGTQKATGRVAGIKNPAAQAEQDFRSILRGVKKNLILMDEFVRMAPELSSPKGKSL